MAKQALLNDTPENLVKRFKSVITRSGIPVTRMILFGSYAKGTAKSWSDVDVCVVSTAFGKDFYREMARLARLTLHVDTMIEPFPFHPDDLEDRYDPLAAEIRKTGIVIS